MKLRSGLHLAYCTNVHPAETWEETLGALNRHVLPVKERVQRMHPGFGPYAVGLRLSDTASRELLDGTRLAEFRRWLDRNDCYVFTINGFPFGQFHGTRVKEKVYTPDWSDPLRLEYTNRLFEILAAILPEGVEGSVSTLPGSFKGFVTSPDHEREIRNNLRRCASRISEVSRRSGRLLHLGLEPEPLGLFENTTETLRFFERLRAEDPGNELIPLHLGVNYDTCHFAIQYEEPETALASFATNGIRISKVHLSNALDLKPNSENLARLTRFADDTYLHQVIRRFADGSLRRHEDLPLALESALSDLPAQGEEWRVHFHVPLHCPPMEGLKTTSNHVEGLFRHAAAHPGFCTHFEMETYTWGVLPEDLRTRQVEEQIVSEYDWTLRRMQKHSLA